MFFPFLNYETFSETGVDDTTATIVTLSYKAFVIAEVTRGDINANNELIRVYADNVSITDFNNEINLLYMSGADNDLTGSSYTLNNMHSMPLVLPSGSRVRVQAVNESNVNVTLHVFRLPTNV